MELNRLIGLVATLLRFTLVPIYVGMLAALMLITIKFGQNLLNLALKINELSVAHTILGILSLIDLALVSNLVVMVIAAGLRYFVPMSGRPDDRSPAWLIGVSDDAMKLRLIAAIILISAIDVLKAFMHIADLPDRDLYWTLGIHLSFVVSWIILAHFKRE